jgi:3-isopropylmalate dehydrogenase
VKVAIESGLRTGDIHSEGTQRVGTREMGEAIARSI